MTAFDKLRTVTEKAQCEQELPDFLAERIFGILDNREAYGSREVEIDDLAEKVAIYDSYGQTGYIGMGVNSVILEKTLDRLEAMPHINVSIISL